MNEESLDFAVASIVDGTQMLGEPYRTVIGRCGNTPISVGDVFDAIIEYDEPRNLLDYERDPVVISRDPVELTVRHISAYQREWSALERGMTGSLVVTGEGLQRLVPRCTLSGIRSSIRQNGSRSPVVSQTESHKLH